LGVHIGNASSPPAAVVHLAQARLEARRRKDWSEADRLRREVETQGWIIQDASDGFRVKRNPDPRVSAQIGNGSSEMVNGQWLMENGTG
ncbi:MAG: hypothetical protein KJ964_01960, partial [Verrucomicrobia bacterium]|nr:hypothetical protein [Verrucomicrobiota bacterium]